MNKNAMTVILLLLAASILFALAVAIAERVAQ